MNNNDIDLPISDRFAKPAILSAVLIVSPRNDVGEPLDVCVRILLGDKLLELADLSLVTLAVGRDAGV
ncbi:hypothetical protein DM2_1 [Halorubrum sp. DM2]|uniref:hypothetical protein n=1 Tax=Halorubrum sp. DM2 TaxID=2527867 RepID=UPI0024B84AF9|nr:hypothetical protein [Halorubrum sp. DM2]VTT85119.1 hypothetical protein DM2_1 [Halorubrum sp. DM2]